MTAISAVFAALFGLAFGSFLNVCITRLPQHGSMVRPRSRCPRCLNEIAAFDNVPLLSWALLRGRCRSCRQPIPIRYPLVEAAVAGLFVACLLVYGFSLEALGAAVFCWLMVGLCVTDAETFLLPDALTLPGLALGVAYRAALAGAVPGNRWREMARAGFRAALAAAAAALALLLIRWIYYAVRRRTGLGLGDVKLFAMIAAWLGFEQSALVLFLAVVFGAIYGVCLLALGGTKQKGEPIRVPLGCYLCSAGLYALFFGPGTLGWYLHLFPDL